jgi:hypothetical protein
VVHTTVAHTGSTDAPRLQYAVVLGERTGVFDPWTPSRDLGRRECFGHFGVQDVLEATNCSIVRGWSNLQQIWKMEGKDFP